MTTLGELFDVAVAQLQEAAQTPLASVGPEERVALTEGLVDVLGQIRKGLGPGAYTPVPTSEERWLTVPERNLDEYLDQASAALSTAQRYLRTPAARDAGPAGARIDSAARTLGAVRDTIGSHLGPDRAPLTPYAYLLRHQSAFYYLSGRYAEVAWQAGQVVQRLAQGSEHPGATEAFESARTHLDKASVLTRVATRETDAHLGAFPLALPVEPVRASPADPTDGVVLRLGEDSERLSRAAYLALHDRDERRLSGSDLQQLSRWTSMARLLVGRVLLRVAEGLPDGAVADGAREAAAVLRESSQAWKTAAGGWRHVVDTTDPREHPDLPPPGYDLVQRGQVVRLPSTTPHPAVVISHTSTTRVGQLLFGPRWTADQGPGTARPAADILADAGGPGPLVAALYRLPSSGWQLAAAAPWAIRRAGATLVSDVVEHRPPGLDKAQRFYPVHRREVEALTGAYSAVMAAEQKTAGALLEAARRTGTAVPRAVLDAYAHRAIAQEQRWAPAQQVQPKPQQVPRAYVPQELLVRRPGARR
ncbi:hypothetical protein [Streptomyces sp. NPDC051211]|uniref:hypothetical protein n=1 Tax=Streptomyces sp. NPDC051211 TaxID=3154643 RepID=UPI00344B9BFC